MNKYALTEAGKKKFESNEFYGQNLEQYKGNTYRVFEVLYHSIEPLTVKEISKITGLPSYAICPSISYHKSKGRIEVK